jgi:hypothetical protein
MIGGGLEGCGPSQPLPAVNQHPFTAPTERTPSSSRDSATNGVNFGLHRSSRCPGTPAAQSYSSQYTVTEHTSMVSEYKRPAVAAALNRLADSVSHVIWSRKR